jgi:DNA-binding transcriptional LysR family regulator
MVSLRRRLPPANSLVVFEAAARHLNFTRAAKELGVTQAAVSHQLQLLEDISARRCSSAPRHLKLTPAGQRLYKAVTMGLEHIAGTAVELRRIGPEADLTVSSSVTFASYWLMHRVAKFRAAHPEIELKLVASAPVSDLASAGVDLAVRYGSGRWPGVRTARLMDNEIFAVCAPGYHAATSLSQPADLLDEVLLHLAEYDRNWVTGCLAEIFRRRGAGAPARPHLRQLPGPDPGRPRRPGRGAGRRPSGGGFHRKGHADPAHGRHIGLRSRLLSALARRQRAEPARPALPRLDHRRGQGGKAGRVMHPRPVCANLAAMFAYPDSAFLAPSRARA